ncbi:YceK/YidQ family lipoprotein [Cedecea davisae]|uniref:YceK/YidQ family lipoprotein n=1 Tax=Cedecea davisae TaxID=158484 RepID=UPI00376EDF4F
MLVLLKINWELTMKRILLLICMSSLLSGCGMMFGRHDGEYSGGIYPATQFDFRAMGATPFPVPLLLILDLPFSIVSDTIMIPADM